MVIPRRCGERCWASQQGATLSRLVKIIFLAALGLAAVAAEVRAQPALILVEENDALVSQRDYGYTQGFLAALAFNDFFNKSFVDATFDLMGGLVVTYGAPAGLVRRQFNWVVGQSIFTPENLKLVPPNPNDRPYAGWLFTGFSLAQETAKVQLDSFEFLGGVVGPAAGGKTIQCGFHSALGQSCPAGWSYQLDNEPAFLASWERRWKFGVEYGDGFGADIVPSVGATVGNVYTYASAGALLRFGRSLSSTWGPSRVRPAPQSASFFSPDPQGPAWGFAFFAGAEGRAVGYNVFLDGNTFVSSPSVNHQVFVADLVAGAEIFSQYGSRLAFTVTKRTQEFSGQPGNGDLFGSIEARVQF